MMNLIIIDEDSRINGIGTYLRDIILIFKQIVAVIYRINHNNTLDVFSVKKNDEIITFSFSSRLLESYNKIIDKFYETIEKFITWICKKFDIGAEDYLIRDFQKETNTFIDPVKQIKHEEREKEWDLER